MKGEEIELPDLLDANWMFDAKAGACPAEENARRLAEEMSRFWRESGSGDVRAMAADSGGQSGTDTASSTDVDDELPPIEPSSGSVAPGAMHGNVAKQMQTEIASGVEPSTGFIPGAQVSVTGLQARPELNGLLGVLEEFDGAKGRWVVRLAETSSTKLFRQDNVTLTGWSERFGELRQRTCFKDATLFVTQAHNALSSMMWSQALSHIRDVHVDHRAAELADCCERALEDITIQAHSCDEMDPASDSAGSLCDGLAVRLHSLKGATELNGKLAFLMRFLLDSGRWEVAVEAVGKKRIKADNLLAIARQDADADFLATLPVDCLLVLAELRFRAGVPMRAFTVFHAAIRASAQSAGRKSRRLAHMGAAAAGCRMNDSSGSHSALVKANLAAALALHRENFRSLRDANVVVDLNPGPGRAALAFVILHGFGPGGHDLVPQGQLLQQKLGIPCRLVFPEGLYNQKAISWLDNRMDPNDPFSWDSPLRAMSQICMVLDVLEADGIPPSRVVLGGFSQGTGIAALVAFTRQPRLGGVLILGGGVQSRTMDFVHAIVGKEGVPCDIPVFVGNGALDRVVTVEFGQRTVETLKASGFSHVEFQVFPGEGHGFPVAMVSDIAHSVKRWMKISV